MCDQEISHPATMWPRFTVLFHLILYLFASGRCGIFIFLSDCDAIDIDTNTHYNAHPSSQTRYSGIEVTAPWEYSYLRCAIFSWIIATITTTGKEWEEREVKPWLCHYEDRHAYVALRENISSCLPDRSSLTWERLLHRKQSFNCNPFSSHIAKRGMYRKKRQGEFLGCATASS